MSDYYQNSTGNVPNPNSGQPPFDSQTGDQRASSINSQYGSNPLNGQNHYPQQQQPYPNNPPYAPKPELNWIDIINRFIQFYGILKLVYF